MSNPFSFSVYKIDKKALITNVKILKKSAGNKTFLCAMAKADCYGIGARYIAPVIKDYVKAFAVANLHEGIELRNLGIDNEIFVMSPIDMQYLDLFSVFKLTPTIASLTEMNNLSRRAKKPIRVQIKVDSGLNRYGFMTKKEILEALNASKENVNIKVVGMFSHLATKQENDNYVCKQQKYFDEIAKSFETSLVGEKYIHLSNTSAIISHGSFDYNMVRSGFGLYGLDKNLSNNFVPVISIVSKVVSIKEVEEGSPVGYDCTYIAQRKMTIGIVPLGYYDGIDRRLSNRGYVLYNGCLVRIVGRVCMDCFMVDLTDVYDANIGDEVVILGKSKNKEITLKDLSEWTGTSQYDLLVHLSSKRMKVVVE